MENMVAKTGFWKNKRVLVTGHTGFKGSWLSLLLHQLGAKLYGYSLSPKDTDLCFNSMNLEKVFTDSSYGEIADQEMLEKFIKSSKPEVLFHLAAQAFVRTSILDPLTTIIDNVIGTTAVLNIARYSPHLKSIVIVTSDKCYRNDGEILRFNEDSPLGGSDPYSASKACAEIVTKSFVETYFRTSKQGTVDVGVATARAGNVFGGGDWGSDRLIPDAFKAYAKGEPLILRSPDSTRPWQYVLDPICGYLSLAERLYDNPSQYSGAWNFGPSAKIVHSVSEIIDIISEFIPLKLAKNENLQTQFYEQKYLQIDSEKANRQLHWAAKTSIRDGLRFTAKWYISSFNNEDMYNISMSQLAEHSN